MTVQRPTGFVWTSILVLANLFLLPVAARAQSASSGSIAGLARDATGAVLPGVTVEAASPALIEKVRVAVTDDQGQYKILELRPGVYTVTFTLPGFSTLKREGVELTTGFTAQVSADMKVGEIAETLTVTAASPIVDVQNSRTQTVLSRQVLDTLPTGKTIHAYATITVGAFRRAGQGVDVGGDQGESNMSFTVHGNSVDDSRMTMDGMLISSFVTGGTGSRLHQLSQMAISEVALTTRGITAEAETGGVQINNVPKDGGNMFSLSATASGANSSMQTATLTDQLRTRGLTTAPGVKKVYDFGVGVGGPISKDRLWFYGSTRYWGSANQAPGNYFADRTTPAARGGLIYIPDLNRPAYNEIWNEDYSGRLTWQASQRQKLATYISYAPSCSCYGRAVATGRAPENTPQYNYRPHLTQATWSYPATNRLLFDAGLSVVRNKVVVPVHDGITKDDVPMTELSTGYLYNAYFGTLGPNFNSYGNFRNDNSSQKFSASYVTGTHAFKAGVVAFEAWQDYNFESPAFEYQFRNQLPSAIRQWAAPQKLKAALMPNLGIYAQDQWTISRLTMNLGVRFDHISANAPAIQIPAGPFVPARDFPAVENVPNWKDVSPRVGVSYDLFGTSKTAVKAVVGKYMRAETFATIVANLPATRIATNATRSWTDTNADFVPNCDLTNKLANGECGQMSNLSLGSNVAATTFSEDVTKGSGVRPYMWESDVTLQHELRAGMSIAAGYYRSWYGNYTVTDNLRTVPGDFDPYCFATPTDARLPGGGNQRLCGLYNINPAKFGQVDNLVTSMETFGTQTEVYNGVDVNFQSRFGRGGYFQVGASTGQTVFNNCVVVDSPEAARPGFCDNKMPYEGQTQLKASAIYPLPWYGMQLSGVYQNAPGVPIVATWNVPAAQITPSLGRPLAGNAATTPVNLIEPNTMFEDRLSQLDIRLTKIFKIGRGKLQGSLDVYNLFDARTILVANPTYGPTWLQPQVVLGGRMFKFAGQFDF